MTVRKNQANLTPAEKRAFVNAVVELKRRGRYDPFVTTHREIFISDMTGPIRQGHESPSFLPWHRQYLIDFERALQSINPNVSIPYWDWTRDRTPTSSLWSANFLGGNGRRPDGQVMNGPFAHSTGNWSITVQDDTAPFLRRAMAPTGMPLPTRAELNTVLAVTPYDMTPWDFTAPGFRNSLEGGAGPGLHNRVHNWVGGQMLQSVSPNDPVFWLHHCFVDKVWADWQRRHPQHSYLPAVSTTGVVALNQAMAPWNNVTPAAMLDHTRFYTYA
ncbi:tyrosinase family protein [Streptomyces uncialis]|uniref:tyrosinase family protein n=1 Tax=Streptomyces uncialis TaxID=1048205 RepID=UPI002E3453C7|nr:tyrosinase family protein [Streptomyces uncialis]